MGLRVVSWSYRTVPNSEILNSRSSRTSSLENSSWTAVSGWRSMISRKSRPTALALSSSSRSFSGIGSE
jgi:hypothetical protein